MGEVQVQGSFGRDCPSEEGRQGMRDAEDGPSSNPKSAVYTSGAWALAWPFPENR